MFYGGNLIKVVNSNLIVNKTRMYMNDVVSKSGGIHLSYSNVEVYNSEFNVDNSSDRFYFDAAKR
jgi:hypothetical protein